MKREIVASRTQISVVGIRLPYHLHAEDAAIELGCTIDIGDAQGEMSQSSINDHVIAQSIRSSRSKRRDPVTGDGPNRVRRRVGRRASIDRLDFLKRSTSGKVLSYHRHALMLVGAVP
jgi:hypothetical protein